MLADLLAKRLLFATAGKVALVWAALAEELLQYNHHPKAIQHVTIDKRTGYIKGVSDNHRDARVVFDKIDVVQHAVTPCG